MQLNTELSNIQKKKIDFLIERGGQIIDSGLKVWIKTKNNEVAWIDQWGKVGWTAEQTLAEKCFSAQAYDEELNKRVEEILGIEDFSVLIDIDSYDNSIEVMRRENSSPMNREQADKILLLGFGVVYESIGEMGKAWYKTYEGKCNPRVFDEDNVNIRVLSAKLVELREKEQYNCGAESVRLHKIQKHQKGQEKERRVREALQSIIILSSKIERLPFGSEGDCGAIKISYEMSSICEEILLLKE